MRHPLHVSRLRRGAASRTRGLLHLLLVRQREVPTGTDAAGVILPAPG